MDDLYLRHISSGFPTAGYRWDKLSSRRMQDPLCLEQYGYKVFSQNDEDGILEEIFNRIGTTSKRFIEFGVQDGLESNTHLLLHKGWSGLWIEGNDDQYNAIQTKFQPMIATNRLQVLNAYVTSENINDLFSSQNFCGEIDLLSVDIDGNDYHVLEAVEIVNPRVIVSEYNGKFPPDVAWVMRYDPQYRWNGTDCHGASLKALADLGRKKGYQLVGTNLIGVNAFFVRANLSCDLFYQPAEAEALYNPLRLWLQYKNGHPSNRYLCSD